MLSVIEYFAKLLKITQLRSFEITPLSRACVSPYITISCLYLIPFLRHSLSNNGVTLKCGLRVVQGY